MAAAGYSGFFCESARLLCEYAVTRRTAKSGKIALKAVSYSFDDSTCLVFQVVALVLEEPADGAPERKVDWYANQEWRNEIESRVTPENILR